MTTYTIHCDGPDCAQKLEGYALSATQDDAWIHIELYLRSLENYHQ